MARTVPQSPLNWKAKLVEAAEGFFADDHEVGGEVPEALLGLRLTVLLPLLSLWVRPKLNLTVSGARKAVTAQTKSA